jgi:hypothetical protein
MERSRSQYCAPTAFGVRRGHGGVESFDCGGNLKFVGLIKSVRNSGADLRDRRAVHLAGYRQANSSETSDVPFYRTCSVRTVKRTFHGGAQYHRYYKDIQLFRVEKGRDAVIKALLIRFLRFLSFLGQ